jgi:3-oxoacyl-[acyl-carrier protein] reductase
MESEASVKTSVAGAPEAPAQLENAGRVALVTGSTKGIGASVARMLLEAGISVVVTGRREADAARVALALEPHGAGEARALPLAADLTDPHACRALVDQTVAHFGRLDLLVNNAGLGRFAPIQTLSASDWDAQMRTNLDAVFHLSQAAIPHLQGSGDAWIFNIASLAGRNPFAGGAAYNATKFGLVGMTEAMMLDLRDLGIRVTCIMPGSVNTHFFGGEPGPEGAWKLHPDDVAQVVIDLLRFPTRALPSRIEIRPTRPPKK